MILCDTSLHAILPVLMGDHYDPDLVNPASIDVRLGRFLLLEDANGEMLERWDLRLQSYRLKPQEFVLAETYEYITIPNGFAADLRLKSTPARKGIDHSLGFWVDPGWSGVLTMELRNNLGRGNQTLSYLQRVGQMIVHLLDHEAAHPYAGKYQGAAHVEGAK